MTTNKDFASSPSTGVHGLSKDRLRRNPTQFGKRQIFPNHTSETGVP